MRAVLEKEIDAYIQANHYRLVESVLVCRRREIIAERYYHSNHQETRHPVFSIWKSIISLCIGICVDRGIIRPEDPVSGYLNAFAEENHPYHRHLKVEDLLTMRSGIYWNGGVHYHCPMLEQLWRSDDWCEYIADVAMAGFPGREFVYKEWDVILLSALIARVTGQSAFEFCMQNIYLPLNIRSEAWGESSTGICYNHIPGKENRADLSAADLLKIGQVILEGGCYGGRQIVSRQYIEAMCRYHTPGYGYLIWLFPEYAACRGLGGQEIIISKEKEAVTVIQAKWSSRGKSYEDIYDNIIKGKL